MDVVEAIAGLDPRSRAALRWGKKVAPKVQKGVKTLEKIIAKGQDARFKKAMRRRDALKQVGETPGSCLSKYNQNRSDGYEIRDSETLYQIDLLTVPRNTTTTSGLNTRERDMIFLTGFKICLTVDSQTPDNLYMNFAVISCKNRGTVDGIDLFRNYTGTSRQINFNDATLSFLDRHCLPINSDEFTVHLHDRKILQNTSTAQETDKKVSELYNKEYWVPIRRQIRFEGNEAQSETRFALIYWFGKVGQTISGSATPTVGVARLEWKTIAVYKEPMPVYKLRY